MKRLFFAFVCILALILVLASNIDTIDWTKHKREEPKSGVVDINSPTESFLPVPPEERTGVND